MGLVSLVRLLGLLGFASERETAEHNKPTKLTNPINPIHFLFAPFPDFRYTILMPSPTLQRLATATIVALTLIPSVASAYMTAEDVLLSKEFFLPPTARETQDRNARQTEISAARREREQQEAYETQHAAAPEEIPEEEVTEEEVAEEEPAAAPALTATDLELLRTLKLLDRITDRQRTLQYGPVDQQGTAHTGAPLAPTGAGAWLAATTMIGAVGWTLRKARKSEKNSWSV